MKIGILTLRLRTNYGGILQAYALQAYLKQQGHDVYTIYHDHDFSLLRKYLSVLKRCVMKIINKDASAAIRAWTTAREEAIISQHTSRFINDNIIRTEKIDLVKGMQKMQDKYNFDAIVVGSDQCWRPATARRIQSLYLEGLKSNKEIKRIAYAVSFGRDKWEYSERQAKDCRELVEKFDAVSVREDSGKKLCKQYLGVDAIHVLDPTFLLDSEMYIGLVTKVEDKLGKSEGNLMVYILDKSDEKREIVEYVKSELNLTTNSVLPQKTLLEKGKKEIKDFVYPPVEKWIQGFRDAEFVVTDSFHGTVFAIIFNKPFIAIGNDQRGMTRFTSLLKTFGLEERLLNSKSELNSELIQKEINFDGINNLILERQDVVKHFFNI